MELLPYKIFETVAATGNMARAAERLHLTPSAVSHAVSRLEEEFGFPLFIREKKGVYLTTYGESLLPQICSILQMQNKLNSEIGLMRSVVKGSVNLGLFNSTVYKLIAPVLLDITSNYPNININLYQRNYDDSLSLLLEHKLDIAFVHPPVPDSLHYVPLIEDPMVCITPKNYQADGGVISLEELHRLSLIQADEIYIYDLKPYFEGNSLNLSSRHSLTDDSAIIALVSCGFGASILPKMVVDGIPGNVNVYEIENSPYRTIGIATHTAQYVTPATELLLETICRVVRQEYPENSLV